MNGEFCVRFPCGATPKARLGSCVLGFLFTQRRPFIFRDKILCKRKHPAVDVLSRAREVDRFVGFERELKYVVSCEEGPWRLAVNLKVSIGWHHNECASVFWVFNQGFPNPQCRFNYGPPTSRLACCYLTCGSGANQSGNCWSDFFRIAPVKAPPMVGNASPRGWIMKKS